MQFAWWAGSHIYHLVTRYRNLIREKPGGRGDELVLILLLASTMSEIGSDVMEGGEAPQAVVKRPRKAVNGVISVNHRPKSEYICPSEYCVRVG